MAATWPWREYWLGRTTILTIIANTVVPGFMDRFLARSAYEGQETSLPVSPSRQDNLFRPVNELHRTRGSFQARSGAVLVPGPVARLGVVAAGAMTFLGAGYAAGRVLGRAGPRHVQRAEAPSPGRRGRTSARDAKAPAARR